MENNTIWRVFQITNTKELDLVFERYQLVMKKIPTKALISDRCPDGVAEMIKPYLLKYDIGWRISHYVMPYELWLTNEEEKVQEHGVRPALFRK